MAEASALLLQPYPVSCLPYAPFLGCCVLLPKGVQKQAHHIAYGILFRTSYYGSLLRACIVHQEMLTSPLHFTLSHLLAHRSNSFRFSTMSFSHSFPSSFWSYRKLPDHLVFYAWKNGAGQEHAAREQSLEGAMLEPPAAPESQAAPPSTPYLILKTDILFCQVNKMFLSSFGLTVILVFPDRPEWFVTKFPTLHF